MLRVFTGVKKEEMKILREHTICMTDAKIDCNFQK